MANNLSGRPWILDTANANVPAKPGQTFTTGFVFRNYTGGVASLAVIRDLKRNVDVCTLPGAADGSPVSEFWIAPQVINDLTVRLLDSGQVEVVVR